MQFIEDIIGELDKEIREKAEALSKTGRIGMHRTRLDPSRCQHSGGDQYGYEHDGTVAALCLFVPSCGWW